MFPASRHQIPLVHISCVRPDRPGASVPLSDLLKQASESLLILFLEGISSQQRQPRYILRLQRIQDIPLRLFVKRLSISKVPCLRLKAALTVVPAAGYKQRCSAAGTVCDIIFLDH